MIFDIKKFTSSINNRDNTIEKRLLYLYIACEMIWFLLLCIYSFFLGLEKSSIVFGVSEIGLLLLVGIFRIYKNTTVMKWVFQIISLFGMPIIWLAVGGNQSSANAMFILEMVLFTMINTGIFQIIFIFLSWLSSSIVSGISSAHPELFSGMEMTPGQHYAMSIIVGTTITIWVALLVWFQKYTYKKENAIVIAKDVELEKSNQMQKNFLANMSHEIRSPLGIVLGFNDLIQKSENINDIKQYSENIKKSGNILKTVINDILDYSKIEAGKLSIIESDYSFQEMIEEINKDIKLRCDEKGLIYEVTCDENIPDNLYGDSIRIRQCLINVLVNAVKYTEKGTVKFTVNYDGLNNNRYDLRFIIEDTGKGIEKDSIPYLFTAFKRLNEEANRKIEGTGLGLAITKLLLDEMMGEVSVESVVGEGSTFTITLSQAPATSTDLAMNIAEAVDISGKKLLVVDDIEMNTAIMEISLGSEGCNVTTASSGNQAVSICQNEKFDIILMDHMMPGMDGVETLKLIRKDSMNKETKVIALTANAMAGSREEYLSYGFDGYVSKPVEIPLLKKEIYQCFNN